MHVKVFIWSFIDRNSSFLLFLWNIKNMPFLLKNKDLGIFRAQFSPGAYCFLMADHWGNVNTSCLVSSLTPKRKIINYKNSSPTWRSLFDSKGHVQNPASFLTCRTSAAGWTLVRCLPWGQQVGFGRSFSSFHRKQKCQSHWSRMPCCWKWSDLHLASVLGWEWELAL